VRTGGLLNSATWRATPGVADTAGPLALRAAGQLSGRPPASVLPEPVEAAGQGPPRLYFLDTAIASYLLGLHAPEPLIHGPSWGPLFETACVAEMIKHHALSAAPAVASFFRTATGLEVDLVLEHGPGWKASNQGFQDTSPHWVEPLRRFAEIVPGGGTLSPRPVERESCWQTASTSGPGTGGELRPGGGRLAEALDARRVAEEDESFQPISNRCKGAMGKDGVGGPLAGRDDADGGWIADALKLGTRGHLEITC